MKNLLFITLFLTPFIGISQTTKPIEGFLGIKFGSSKAVVMAAMKAKGAIFDKENSDKDDLGFSNVKLGTRDALIFLVKFVNDKAFEADYIFDPEVEAKVIGQYNDLVDDIARIYGPGKKTKDYTSPYEEGDGYVLTGLGAGKVDFHTLWSDVNNNTIKASITIHMQVMLTYQDSVLTDEAISKQQDKEKSDF